MLQAVVRVVQFLLQQVLWLGLDPSPQMVEKVDAISTAAEAVAVAVELPCTTQRIAPL